MGQGQSSSSSSPLEPGTGARPDLPQSPLPITAPSKPYWLEDLPPVLSKMRQVETGAVQQLCKPNTRLHVGTVVIGGGMAGISVAYHLALGRRHCISAGENTSVLVLEARGLCGGATGRNGGFLHAHGWSEFWPLFKKHGLRTAAELVKFELAGREAIHQVSKKLGIDCDIDSNVEMCMLFDDEKKSSGMRETLGVFYPIRSALKFAGIRILNTFEDIQKAFHVVDSSKECRIGSAIAIGSGCDTFNPAKFVLGVAREAINLGVEIATNTVVVKVDKTDNIDGRLTVHTNRGTLTCDKIVYCTNAWTSHLVPDFSSCVQPVLNTVVSSTPNTAPLLRDVSRRTGNSMFPGYNYWHQRKDGRIVLGGFRNLLPNRGVSVAIDDEPNASIVQTAVEFLPSLGFDINFDMEYSWTGIIGWSTDGLAFVGPLARSQPTDQASANCAPAVYGLNSAREFVCCGFSGHGMPQAWNAGRAAAEMVNGRHPSTSNIPYVNAFMPTLDRMKRAKVKGGDWFSYEKGENHVMQSNTGTED